jgi:DNA-binding IclR family transcriptional regulator
VQILDLLTTNPGRGFTLSELSRRLLINKATTHRLLGTLTEHGLLVRHPDTQHYRLGPALIPMGAVAERGFPALKYAEAEAEQLAEDYDAECVVIMLTGEEILVIGHAGVPGPRSFATFAGQRHPLLPPAGTIFLAWKSDAEIEAWLDRSGDQLADDERQYYREAVDVDRGRGYTFALRVPGLADLAELYAAGDPHTRDGRRMIRQMWGAVAHDRGFLAAGGEVPPDAEVSSVAAPVFGPDGTMLFALCLVVFGGQYRGHDIPRIARDVVRAAGRVTRAVDGRQPAGAGHPSPPAAEPTGPRRPEFRTVDRCPPVALRLPSETPPFHS